MFDFSTPPRLSILVVDDDEDLRAALQDYLKEVGYRVQVAGSCREAQRLLEQAEPPFDMLLTDLVFPEGDGLELIRAAKNRHQDTLSALMTGYASLETALEAIRLGAYDYITKPFNFDEIGILLRNMSEKVCLLREYRKSEEKLQQLYQKMQLMQDEKIELMRLSREVKQQFEKVNRRLDQLEGLLQVFTGRVSASPLP